jgi:hypothetical protein
MQHYEAVELGCGARHLGIARTDDGRIGKIGRDAEEFSQLEGDFRERAVSVHAIGHRCHSFVYRLCGLRRKRAS